MIYARSYDSDGDHVHESTKTYFVCPHCTVALSDIKAEPFPEGLWKYVKAVHKWDSTMCRGARPPEGRIKELLEHFYKRIDEENAAKDKKRRIEEAKRVLREAGELKE